MQDLTRNALAVAFALTAMAAPAGAEAGRETAVSQIEQALRQPFLANRMGAFQCFADSGHPSPAGAAAVAEARAAYGTAHAALASAATGAPAAALAEVEATWPGFDALLGRMASDAPRGPRDFDTMLRGSATLAVAGGEIARRLGEAAAASGGLGVAEAIQVARYGQQLDLAQSAMKQYCLAARGDRGIGVRFELAAGIAALSAGLEAAAAGAPEAGLAPPATPDIAARLAAAGAAWTALRPALQAAADGATPSAEAVQGAIAAAETLIAALSDALGLYAAHAAAGAS